MNYRTIKVEGKDTYLIANSPETLETANHLRNEFTQPRLISVDGNILTAVKAAYRTASGLHSEANGVITPSIYRMSKIEVAMMIASTDNSDEAFDQAAYELATDAFVTGKLEERAQELSNATGRHSTVCMLQIYEKLNRLDETMRSKTRKLMAAGITPESADQVRDEIIASGGKYLLSLPTAYGKTSKICEPVIKHYLAEGKKVLVISHRRSINKNIANIPGIVSYDECNHPDIIANARGLKIVVNSLSAPKFKTFIEATDLVVVDEASQVISHVLGGEVKHRKDVWDALQSVVKNTQNVILADADINKRCASLAGPEARLYKIKQQHKDITIRTGDINQVRGMAIAAAAAGENVLISCDTVKECKALAKAIEGIGRKALVITAESAQWEEQAAFIANPNSTEHGVVIYSPVITSALSITSNHFTAHFGIFFGQIVPTDAIQMLRRDRTATSFTLGLKNPEYKKAEVVAVRYRADVLKAAGIEQQAQLYALDQELEGMAISDEYKRHIRELFVSKSKTLAFDLMQYRHLADEAWLKDRIQNTLPATLLEQGFNVEVLEHNEEHCLEGFKSNSMARRAVKKETAEKLVKALAAGHLVVDAVADGGSKDEVEHVAVSRANAQQVMRKEVLTEADALIWGDGEGAGKIERFRALFSDDLQVPLESIKEAVDVMHNSKTWTSERSVELFDKLNTVRAEVIGMGILISNAKSAQAKAAAIPAILKQFGISARKVDGGKNGKYYCVTDDSLNQMKSYL